jgi:Predicted AAA-ATPase.
MVSNPDFYFLSRPRRFGKSLLISILKHLYSGHKEYFKGLWIDQHTIQITFRHAKLLKNQLIYVSDSFGLMEIKERLNKTKLTGADEWQQGPISFYQDTIEKRTTLGNPYFF